MKRQISNNCGNVKRKRRKMK